MSPDIIEFHYLFSVIADERVGELLFINELLVALDGVDTNTEN